MTEVSKLDQLVDRCDTLVHGIIMNDAEALRLCVWTIAACLDDAKAELLRLRSPTEARGGPVAWFLQPDDNGVYQQVAKEHYGEPDLVPLYASHHPAREAVDDALVEALRHSVRFNELYAGYIRDFVKASEIENHPYLPSLEDAINEANSALAALQVKP
jgi:hypothetical protein